MGTKEFFGINVPPDCELQFEDRSVIVFVDERNTENHSVIENVFGSTITNGMVTLTLERVENGVTISG